MLRVKSFDRLVAKRRWTSLRFRLNPLSLSLFGNFLAHVGCFESLDVLVVTKPLHFYFVGA